MNYESIFNGINLITTLIHQTAFGDSKHFYHSKEKKVKSVSGDCEKVESVMNVICEC
jgi:hypothetical protein